MKRVELRLGLGRHAEAFTYSALRQLYGFALSFGHVSELDCR